MSMKRVMHNSTGRKVGDQVIGRLPPHVDPDERLIVIQMGQSVGKTDRPLNYAPASPGRTFTATDFARQIANTGAHVLASPRNMMEGPAASATQPAMNRAARRKAARQRTK